MMRAFKSSLFRHARQEDGSSTIPFVLFLPFIMMMVLSSFEMGRMLFRQTTLERALDMTVRDLRLGIWVPGNAAALKQRLCSYSGNIPNCTAETLIDLQPVSKSTWNTLAARPTCVDHDAAIQPATRFDKGTSNEFMLIRVCTRFYPIIPRTGLALALTKDPSGAYALAASSGFVNEPRPGS